jgi:hypothetical protein
MMLLFEDSGATLLFILYIKIHTLRKFQNIFKSGYRADTPCLNIGMKYLANQVKILFRKMHLEFKAGICICFEALMYALMYSTGSWIQISIDTFNPPLCALYFCTNIYRSRYMLNSMTL